MTNPRLVRDQNDNNPTVIQGAGKRLSQGSSGIRKKTILWIVRDQEYDYYKVSQSAGRQIFLG